MGSCTIAFPHCAPTDSAARARASSRPGTLEIKDDPIAMRGVATRF
jgi:hypothetical protein